MLQSDVAPSDRKELEDDFELRIAQNIVSFPFASFPLSCPPPSVLLHYLYKVPSNPSVEAPLLCRKTVRVDDAKQSKTIITAVKLRFVLSKHGVCFVAYYNMFQEFRKQKSF